MAGKSGGVVLDTVMIEIESNAGHATNNIDNLAKSLENLKSSIKGGFNNINKLAKGLEELKNASKGLGATVTNLTKLEGAIEPLNRLREIKTPTGLKNITNILTQLPDAMAKIDGKPMENISKISQQLSEVLSPLAAKLADISNGFDAVSKLASKYGRELHLANNESKDSVAKFGKMGKSISFMKNPFKQVTNASNDFTKTATKGFKNLYSKIKQVGLSLLGTRTLFTMVRKAVSEYMQMDQELSKATTNLWRALGAQLAPAIEGVLYIFKQFVRVIYSVVKAITGIDLIARANAKAMSSWGKSAKDTLGSLQKFDDLNVVDFGKGTGEDAFIDLQTIDLSPIQRIIDLTKELIAKFKEALDTGKWEAVGVALGSVINGIFDFINVDAVTNKLKEVATNFGEFINGVVMEVDWSKIGGTLGGLYAAIFQTINSAIEAISWEGIGVALADFINGDALKNIITSMIDMSKSTISGAGGLLDGLFGTTIFTDLANIINEIIQGIQNLGSTIVNTLGENTAAGKIFKTLEEILGSVISLVGGIANTILEWTVSPEFQSLLNTVLDYVEMIFGWVDELFTSISDWYNSEGANILKEIIGNLTVIIDDCLQAIKPVLEEIWSHIMFIWNTIIEPLATFILQNIDLMLTSLRGVLDFVVRLFKGDIKGAFESIGDTIKNVTDKGRDMWKSMVNAIINFVETLINRVISSINKIIRIYNGTLGDFFGWLGFEADIREISTISIPRLETGTNEVPYDNMLAVLHQGEAVVPKKYNPALGGGNSQEMLDRFDRLIFLMENQEQTTNVYVGNKKLYQEQKKYNNRQYNKYGTLEV